MKHIAMAVQILAKFHKHGPSKPLVGSTELFLLCIPVIDALTHLDGMYVCVIGVYYLLKCGDEFLNSLSVS